MPELVFDQSRDTGVSTLEPSRALVPLTVSPRPETSAASTFRPDARFVTHLIATATHLPQTRSLRRADPLEAVTIYSGASETPVAANGLTLARVA